MNNKIDTEKIRSLLEEAVVVPEATFSPKIIKIEVDAEKYYQALSLLPPPCSAEPSCDNCRMRETCGAKGEPCNDYSKDETLPTYQTTSVLPKQPCEKCGGSEKVWPADEFGLREEGTDKIPCPACQAPAGEVEGKWYKYCKTHKTVYNFRQGDCPLCLQAKLEAQAKQIKELEDGAFAANEEAQIRNDKIQQLEAENRWIPVSERLPENVRDVWIALKAKATDSYIAGIGFYSKGLNGYSWEIYGDGLLTEVTHWKLITLPKKD